MQKVLTIHTVNVHIAIVYSVQRQPKLIVRAAPITGPMVGPPTTQTAKKMTAIPLGLGAYRSPRAATTFDIGADPKMPPKNRVIKIPAKVLLTAVPMLRIPRQKIAGKILHLRPYASLRGAHRQGPNAKPSTYNDTVNPVIS
jgi:hypothetical protein